MNDVQDFHRQAMRLADEAAQLRRQGDPEGARQRLQQAFEQEGQAAELSAVGQRLEPTCSVLYRSAASLALECGNYREAERLIAAALSGNPPDEIADELRDLLEQVYFGRTAGRRRSLSNRAARQGA